MNIRSIYVDSLHALSLKKIFKTFAVSNEINKEGLKIRLIASVIFILVFRLGFHICKSFEYIYKHKFHASLDNIKVSYYNMD